MKSNIEIQVKQAGRGMKIEWREEGLERHVWIEQSAFEEVLARGDTVYLDTPAIAVKVAAVD
jgi:pyruvate kinase